MEKKLLPVMFLFSVSSLFSTGQCDNNGEGSNNTIIYGMEAVSHYQYCIHTVSITSEGLLKLNNDCYNCRISDSKGILQGESGYSGKRECYFCQAGDSMDSARRNPGCYICPYRDLRNVPQELFVGICCPSTGPCKLNVEDNDDTKVSGSIPNITSREYSNSSIIPRIGVTITDQAAIYLTGKLMTVFVPSVYTVVFIVSLPLNIMAIIMFLLKMKLKKPAVVYMLNLAAADVLNATLLPFSIAYRFSGNNWLLGDGMCRFVTAVFYCNMYCSILLMTSMSVDRFLAVVYPMQSLSWRTVRRAWLVCLFIWVISITSTVPLLTRQQTQYIITLNITACYDMLDLDDLSFYVYYFTTFILAFFFLPLIITTVCYIGTIRSLSSSKLGNVHKKNRAVFLTVLVLCVFILCFGPTNVLFLIHYLYFYKPTNETLFFAYIISTCISSISYCLDPLIYYYASSECQRYVYGLLCCNKHGHLQVKQHSATAQKTYSDERTIIKHEI